MAIRIVSTVDGYTVFEKVTVIDNLEPLITVQPGKKYTHVDKLELTDKGQIVFDNTAITAPNYFFCSDRNKVYDGMSDPDPIQQEDPDDESFEDPAITDVGSALSSSDTISDIPAVGYSTARGLISKIGTYYINDTSLMIVPSENLSIISTLPLEKSVERMSKLYANFPTALTPVSRTLKLKPFHSYNIANLWVEYIDDDDLQMKSLDVLAFDNGELTKFGVNGMINIPSAPVIDEKFVSLKYKLDNGPIEIKIEGTPIVPVGQGVTVGKSIFNAILSALNTDGIVDPIYYDKVDFPVLSPSESVIFGIMTDSLPANTSVYHEIYLDISRLVSDPNLFVYVDDYVDMKIGQFIKRLNKLEDSAIGSLFTVVKRIYDNRLEEVKSYFQNCISKTSGIRRAFANSLSLKNPGNLSVTNNGELSDTVKYLDHEFKDYIGSRVNAEYKSMSSCHLAQKMIDLDKTHFLSLMKIIWRENMAKYESKLRAYDFWKNSNYHEKYFQIYKTKDVNPILNIHEGYIGRSPQLTLTIDWSPIVKWNSGRKCSQDENLSNLIHHIETTGKNTIIECLKKVYTYENSAFRDFRNIEISTSIFNRSGGIPHDWYGFLENYPGYCDVNIQVRTICTILFDEMEFDAVDILDSDPDYTAKQEFIDIIGSSKAVNASWNTIFSDKVQSTLQMCIDTDEELNMLLTDLSKFFLSNKRSCLLVKFNDTYVDPKAKYTPFSLFGRFEGDINVGFSDMLKDCLINYDSTRITIRELLKRFNLDFEMDETGLVRDYRINPSRVVSDPTLSVGLLSYIYSDISV